MDNPPFFDRDLSWLSFNYRVLMEAKNSSVPLLERLRFIAIYSSNLDEFFRVRVSNIRSIERIDKKKIRKSTEVSSGLLSTIRDVINDQLNEYGQALQQILKELEEKQIMVQSPIEDLTEHSQEVLGKYFRTKVLAYLRPYIFDINEGEPFLNNQLLYLALKLRNEDKTYFAYVNIPSDVLPRFYHINEKDTHHFVYLDDIIRANIGMVLPAFEIEECRAIKLNKDAELNIDDEYSGDLVEKIQKQIKKRDLGAPSRFLYDGASSTDLIQKFSEAFRLEDNDLVAGGRYHNLNDFFQVYNPTSTSIEFEKEPGVPNLTIDRKQSVMKAMESQDEMLHFPYQDYSYVLQFFNEAASDVDVTDIYVTFYRMASESIIGEALISAANNGKKVIVFMELKARFDEANNLKWSERMKAAGIKIIYSIPGLKVHAKVALVKKKGGRNYGFFGTGNLNEKTAKIYCDYGLFSCDPGMTNELFQVFKFLHKKKEPAGFNDLIVSQFNAIDRFTALIDREIEHARKGKTARLIVKVNNLQEKQMIQKLYEAAEAGVNVTVLARSICCLVPGTHGIKVLRLVDRYLEHARAFYFHNDGVPELYLGSADWMNRNLHSRIEVCFPLKDDRLKQQIIDILELQIADNTNVVELDQELSNVSRSSAEESVNAQAQTRDLVEQWNIDEL